MLEVYLYREHLFIFTELQGPDLYSVLMGSVQVGPAFCMKDKLRALGRQMLQALIDLDEHGVTHCDLKPSNICLTPDLKAFRLIDFGCAVLHLDEKPSYAQPRWYRAPEIALGVPWDGKVDVWALGCVLAEVVLGKPLFQHGANATEVLLASQAAILGPIPEWMIQRTPAVSSLFFTTHSHLYQIDPQGLPKGAYLLEPHPERVKLRDLLAREASAKGYDDVTGIVDFVSLLLTIDPTLRPTAMEAMMHPWLRARE